MEDMGVQCSKQALHQHATGDDEDYILYKRPCPATVNSCQHAVRVLEFPELPGSGIYFGLDWGIPCS